MDLSYSLQDECSIGEIIENGGEQYKVIIIVIKSKFHIEEIYCRYLKIYLAEVIWILNRDLSACQSKTEKKTTKQNNNKKLLNIKRHILHGLLGIGYREPETPC